MSSIWNSISLTASKKATAVLQAEAVSSTLPAASAGRPICPARTMEEFLAAWRSLEEVEERIDYVSSMEQQDMASIFHTEIPPQLLGDMLHTFLAFRQSVLTSSNYDR